MLCRPSSNLHIRKFPRDIGRHVCGADLHARTQPFALIPPETALRAIQKPQMLSIGKDVHHYPLRCCIKNTPRSANARLHAPSLLHEWTSPARGRGAGASGGAGCLVTVRMTSIRPAISLGEHSRKPHVTRPHPVCLPQARSERHARGSCRPPPFRVVTASVNVSRAACTHLAVTLSFYPFPTVPIGTIANKAI
jgi:hypothetical protein